MLYNAFPNIVRSWPRDALYCTWPLSPVVSRGPLALRYGMLGRLGFAFGIFTFALPLVAFGLVAFGVSLVVWPCTLCCSLGLLSFGCMLAKVVSGFLAAARSASKAYDKVCCFTVLSGNVRMRQFLDCCRCT